MLRIPDAASRWVVRMQNGALSQSERHAYEQWLAEDSRRSGEIESARKAWAIARHLKVSSSARSYLAARKETLVRRGDAIRRLRTATWRTSLATTGILIGIIALPGSVPTAERLDDKAVAQTSTDQIRNYELPDQTNITVAADSNLQVSFGAQRRDLILTRGEAFLAVKPDAKRPFTVTAGTHKVTVKGTKFNIDYDRQRDAIEVAVEEGRVLISSHPSPSISTEHLISAGDVVSIVASGPLLYRRITPAQASAWRSKELHFENNRLPEILLEVNRYSAKPLVITNHALDELTLTGQFAAGDVQTLLLSLEEVYGIVAYETAERWELTAK